MITTQDKGIIDYYINKHKLNQCFDNIQRYDMELTEYKKGESICVRGEMIAYIYIQVSGKSKIYRTSPEGKTLLYDIYKGFSIIGEVELSLHTPMATEVQAISDVTCLKISIKSHEAFFKKDVKFLNYVNRELSKKLNRHTTSAHSQQLYPLENRLAGYILHTAEDDSFSENLTSLSEYLGCSYRHLLRTLEQLCTKGILEKQNSCYLLKDRVALTQLGEYVYD